MTHKLMILSTLAICSCSNNIKEVNESSRNHKEPSVQALYQDSDKALNEAFNELTKIAPVLLKKNLKKDQQAWLTQRGESCNHNSPEYPTSLESLKCFTKQNEEQIEVLTHRKMMLQDLLDSQFTGLSLNNTNNYNIDFQANCLCGNIVPYIDSQANRLVTYSSCFSSNNKSLTSEKMTNIEFDELGKLNVNALNKYGSAYQISFEPKGNHIYRIILFGKWGVIKEQTKDMVEAIGIGSNYNSEINKVCADFDG